MSMTYKEDIIVFGKCVCTWCGSDKNLIHIEVSKVRKDKAPTSHDTVICQACFNDVPDTSGKDKGFTDNLTNDERDY